MGLIAVIVIAGILLFTSFGRGILMRLILFAVIAVMGYSWIMSFVNRAQQSVSASVDSATSAPGRLMTSLHDTILEWFGTGGKIMKPLLNAANEPIELYEYCLADKTWVNGGKKVNPSGCQALSGSERTACFEKTLAGLESYNGNSDPDFEFGLPKVKADARRTCEQAFKVQDAMPALLGAGSRAVGELYGYCKVPGTCIESDFDNPQYRDCLKEKFEALGLTGSYCSVFTTSEDREKWRKCVEVAIMQQSAGENLAQQGWDRTDRGVRAIRACRQLP
jgi:hypothetical protein